MRKILVILTAVSLILVAGCANKKVEQVEKSDVKVATNKSEGITKEQTVDGLIFSNATLNTENGMTTFNVTVKNDTQNDASFEMIEISLKDASGNELAKLMGYVDDDIKTGDSRVINSNYPGDLADAVSVEYKIIK